MPSSRRNRTTCPGSYFGSGGTVTSTPLSSSRTAIAAHPSHDALTTLWLTCSSSASASIFFSRSVLMPSPMSSSRPTRRRRRWSCRVLVERADSGAWPAVAVFDADPEGGVRVVQRPHPIDRRGGLAVAQHASVSQCLRDVPVVVAPGHPVAGVTARTGDLADPCAFDAVGAEDLRRLLDAIAHRSNPRSRNSSSTASPATCAHRLSLIPLATMRWATLAATPPASSAA